LQLFYFGAILVSLAPCLETRPAWDTSKKFLSDLLGSLALFLLNIKQFSQIKYPNLIVAGNSLVANFDEHMSD